MEREKYDDFDGLVEEVKSSQVDPYDGEMVEY